MTGIYEGGLQPASNSITDHLSQQGYSAPVDPNSGPEGMTPKQAMGCDPTSGESYKKGFLQDPSYTTAGTGLSVRENINAIVPTEISWNKMK